VAQWVVYKTS